MFYGSGWFWPDFVEKTKIRHFLAYSVVSLEKDQSAVRVVAVQSDLHIGTRG